MYKFVDTVEAAEELILPAEAVSINGEYIENLIEGYRTLYASGRESLEKEFEEYDDTAQNGTVVKYSRFPARTITVGFQLIAESPEEFREAFNKLNGILNVEDAEIIFNDENDKFFIGSPNMNGDIDPGLCSVVGEYEIYCNDPFKYSIDFHEPQASFEESESGLAQTFLIDYAGTVPAYPQYIAEFYNPDGGTDEDNAEDSQSSMVKSLGSVGDCKYVAFLDSNNHILQFGNPDLEDDTETPAPLTLTHRSFRKSGSYNPDTAGEEWESPAKGYSAITKHQQQGKLGTGAAVYAAEQQEITKQQILLAKTSGNYCKYSAVITKVDSRTSSTVKLHAQIKISNMTADISKGATLTVELSCGDKKATKVLKSASVSWEKEKSRSCSFTLTAPASASVKELSNIKLKVTRSNGTYKSGGKTKKATGSTGKLSTKTCKVVEIPYYIAISADSYYLHPSAYGSAIKGVCTGPTLTWTYPENDDGRGAKAFELAWNMKCCTGKTTNETLQMGAFECLLLGGDSIDSSGNIKNQQILAGFLITKKAAGAKGNVYLYIEGKQKYKSTGKTDLTWSSGAFGNHKGFTACKIKSTGSKVEFTLGKTFNKGKARTYKLSASGKKKRVFKVVFGFYRYGAQPAFDWNGINAVRFKKIYDVESELENATFSAGQTLIADSNSCDVLLDDVSTPGIGALGNDWETMCLNPGINQISTAFEQREADSVKVMRRCRSDEAYQGVHAYDLDDDGNKVEVDAGDVEIKTYYSCDSAVDHVHFFESEAGNQIIASGKTFSKVELTAEQFDADPTKYFVLESPVPNFKIQYREVFI